VKVVVIADLHANWPALEALPTDYDRLICLGDLVGFGPQPKACLDYVRERAAVAIRGNHDHTLGAGAEHRGDEARRDLAVATLALHRTGLATSDQAYLAALPLSAKFTADGYRFYATHASPRNNLYSSMLVPDLPDDALRRQVSRVKADFILVAHTHLPMVRGIGSRVVVNPGSLGLPLDGSPEASYAVIDNGSVEIRRVAYDVERAVAALHEASLDRALVARLAATLRVGA
jgi:putative phosphoesterase